MTAVTPTASLDWGVAIRAMTDSGSAKIGRPKPGDKTNVVG